jgi:hypothetical protein
MGIRWARTACLAGFCRGVLNQADGFLVLDPDERDMGMGMHALEALPVIPEAT